MEMAKTSTGKKKRVRKCQLNLLNKTVIAKREKMRQDGLYKPGMGIMSGGYTDVEIAMEMQIFPGRKYRLCYR